MTASIDGFCSGCSKPATTVVGQAYFHDELRWYESMHCKACDARTEADGIGFPPAEIRSLLLQQEGGFLLSLPDVQSAAKVTKLLRVLLQLEIQAAFGLIRSTDAVVYCGTRVECEWLKGKLNALGEAPVITSKILV